LITAFPVRVARARAFSMFSRVSSRFKNAAPLAAVVASQVINPSSRGDGESKRPVAIVDCGSGYTRVKIFSESPQGIVTQSSGGRVVRRTTASGRQMPPLHTVLTQEDHEVAKWVSALREVLEAEAIVAECGGEAVDVLVGATAGVRSALDEAKTVNPASVGALRSALEASGGLHGGRASFKLLTGEEEAALELVAARHCLEGSSDAGAALVAASECGGRGGVGLLSSGGASSQLAFTERGGQTVRALSLPTHIKKYNKACLEKGVKQGLAEYEEHLASLVSQLKATECFVGKLKGTFVAIEMNAGYAGRLAGINGQPMTAAEATAALEAALSAWAVDIAAREAALGSASSSAALSVASNATGGGGIPRPLTWYDMCFGVSAAAALMMVRDLLHPTKAQVVFNRVFDQKAGGSLQPSWSLGCYLESRKETNGPETASQQQPAEAK